MLIAANPLRNAKLYRYASPVISFGNNNQLTWVSSLQTVLFKFDKGFWDTFINRREKILIKEYKKDSDILLARFQRDPNPKLEFELERNKLECGKITLYVNIPLNIQEPIGIEKVEYRNSATLEDSLILMGGDSFITHLKTLKPKK